MKIHKQAAKSRRKFLEKKVEKAYRNYVNKKNRKNKEKPRSEIPSHKLYLPTNIPPNIQKFYKELDCPFFHSLTKKQITHLAKLQKEIWALHRKYRMLLILKSQKIGISSLCILITLWHALTDCRGMELIINAQSDEQAKTHAQDLRRIILNSKYCDYLIGSMVTKFGLLKDEVTKIHRIYLHNPDRPKLPTQIIITGMSPGALLSHKRVAFIWSSDITISEMIPARQQQVWAAMLSRLANSQGSIIVECPARAPSGPVYDTWERYERQIENKEKLNPKQDFHCFKFKYDLGIRDGFFTEEFIVAERRRFGTTFGTFYEADFFASGATWYKPEHFANKADLVTELFLQHNPLDDMISDVTDD